MRSHHHLDPRAEACRHRRAGRRWWIALLLLPVPACRPAPTPAVGVTFSYLRQPATAVVQAHAAAAGVRLVLDTLDPEESPDREVRRALDLVGQPGVVAVAAGTGSRSALNSAPVFAEAEVPVVFASATSRALAQAGPWVFPLAPNDSIEGEGIAAYAAERIRARAALVFFLNDEYGTGLREMVRGALARRGVRVLAEVAEDEASDHDVLLRAALANGRPDVVVVAGRHRDAASIARAVRARLPGVPVVAGDGALALPQLSELAGPAASILRVVAFWVPDTTDQRQREFVRRFRAEAGIDPVAENAFQFDATALLVEAVRELGPRATAAQVRDWLESLGRRRPPIDGLTGPLAFGPGRAPPVYIGRVDGGRFVREAP